MRWFTASIALVMLVPILGTVAFLLTEPTVDSLWEAFYFTVVTIFTVGYGDVYPTTFESQLVAVLIVAIGFTAILTTLQSIFNLFISQDLREELGLPSRRSRMRNHIIICGHGNVGQRIYHQIKDKGERFIIIERDQNRVASLVDSDVPVIAGDATEPDTLMRANIKDAKAMVLTMHDPTNIMVVIAAKRLNPQIFIVSEVEDMRNLEVLRKVGADEIIHCFEMGARVMATKARRMTVDPVCGAELDPAQAQFSTTFQGEKYYFESKECKEAFDRTPGRFVEMLNLTDTCRL